MTDEQGTNYVVEVAVAARKLSDEIAIMIEKTYGPEGVNMQVLQYAALSMLGQAGNSMMDLGVYKTAEDYADECRSLTLTTMQAWSDRDRGGNRVN